MAQVCDGNVIFGRELVGTASWVDGTLLKDFRPIANFRELILGEFRAGFQHLTAVLHKKVYHLVEELHIFNPACFCLFANKTYHCGIDLRLRPKDGRLQNPDCFYIAGGG